jgi:hypothetical protein
MPMSSKTVCLFVDGQLDSCEEEDEIVLGGGGGGGSPQDRAYPFAQTIQNLVKSGAMTDCEGLAAFTGTVATISRSTSDFIQSFGVLIPQTAAGSSAGIPWNSKAVLLNTGQSSGFDPLYQNSPDDTPGWNGDQGHHFAAFLAYGYLHSSTAEIAAIGYEIAQGLFSWSSGTNFGDIMLGVAAAQMGADLASGKIKPSDLPSLINNELCKH